MPVLETLCEWLLPFLPLLITAALASVFWATAYWLLLGRNRDMGNERKFPRQLGLLGLMILAVVAFVLALPVADNTRNQILTLIGLVVSGMFAFSSTTIMANLMAGVMLRMTRPFRTGGFIRVETLFGRVAERGLLDTEIQNESRELIAVPNTYLITHAVSVVRNSGTIVSTTLSLGYDVHHSTVEPLLLQAARQSGLEEPFSHILELGNFSITYRVSGLLRDAKSLLTVQSNLCREILDVLHERGIEIASPTIMNQRALAGDSKLIPSPVRQTMAARPTSAEDIVFDKAEEAEQLELEKKRLRKEIERLEEALKEASPENLDQLRKAIEENRRLFQALTASANEDSSD